MRDLAVFDQAAPVAKQLHAPPGRVEGEERVFGEGGSGLDTYHRLQPSGSNSLTLVSDPREGRVKFSTISAHEKPGWAKNSGSGGRPLLILYSALMRAGVQQEGGCLVGDFLVCAVSF